MNYNYTKRALDIIGAGVGLVLSLPVSAAAIAVLAIENKGDVFFKQPRIGKDGKEFNIFKFKTMRDKWDENGVLLPDSQRVTMAGKFMRKHGIDELPQFINVLKGDMAMVGPRPLRPSILYTPHKNNIPWIDKYLTQRETVRPGLVCYNMAENGSEWTKRLSSDALYTKQSGFIADTAIITKAAYMILKGRQHTCNRTFENTSLSGFVNNVIDNNKHYFHLTSEIPVRQLIPQERKTTPDQKSIPA